MVYRAQAIGGDDDDVATQTSDQIGCAEGLAEGGEQAARAFDEQGRGASDEEGADVLEDIVQSDGLAVFAGGDQGSQGLGEVKGVDLVEGQFPGLE